MTGITGKHLTGKHLTGKHLASKHLTSKHLTSMHLARNGPPDARQERAPALLDPQK